MILKQAFSLKGLVTVAKGGGAYWIVMHVCKGEYVFTWKKIAFISQDDNFSFMLRTHHIQEIHAEHRYGAMFGECVHKRSVPHIKAYIPL